MKNGYAFVYFEKERDAENAIEGLNNKTLFGVERRKITVDWAKGKFRYGKPALKPSKRLFVVNLDPIKTKEHHIETHFKPYGKVVDVRIISNYSFVEFETEEDATKALNSAQGSMILDKPVTIEYSNCEISNEDSDHYRNRRRSQDYGRRHRTRSPRAGYERYSNSPRRSFSNGRSLSPPIYRRRHLSPAYERRRSRDYDRRHRTRSPRPGYERYRNRSRSPHRRRRS